MKVFIYSLKKTIYEGEADVLSLPTADGEISVLENHVPLITSIANGKIRIRKGSGFDETSSVYEVGGGFAEVNPKETILLID
ncbi:MAG: ATP synthase epsilon chain [Candidatus Jorgensenbacteria bacterium GW2011_GWA1_48_13]|uniref:ATP synthase epsilon chain n=2 Tax=Candidatus Joergenseniibacteriota TaxID=1752739 RepID=A0A0G1W8G6_9BACT|nr:MAG: ATP synthase epsilon chain [Candidatus Jorgensenbacteria bacterium GW2011_GWA1_48_13]KKU99320.1 MAG: ATP synthase epsilon chain [Candidatus Jorgensenbacteria bacterium GW2011_GWC1_48_8]KKW15003.1 MAG: ATP synthase epsilon chain [Candidatus Jorgensenbacteria bacterium GW2011_GWB1_50_10]